ncbi:MAG: OB-fold domain-containing protein [Acidimicrobiia bacterium]|nr:OB-fold domain-containing protein [Acidimicrobiia bacterium]
MSAVCAPDEDTLTLAAAAAVDALGHAATPPALIDGLWWGCTRPPFAEGPSHAVLSAALGLNPHAGGALMSGSPHSGIEALVAAADAIAAGSAQRALVVVSDALVPGLGTAFEARCGAGAAAVVLTNDPDGPATLSTRVTRSHPLLDRYRGDAESTTRDLYDARLFREEMFLPAVIEVAEHLAAFDVRAWSLPDPDGRLGGVVAKKIGASLTTSAPIYDALGDTGAAAALLGAVAAFDAAGTVAILATGGGRTTGIAVNVDHPVPGAASVATTIAAGARPATYTEVLRSRGQLLASGEQIPMGVPPESALFARGADEMLQLLGGKCAECGTINTPPSIHPTCIACGGAKLEPVPLDRHGRVHTFVINQTMPAPFVAPLPIAVVDLDDGARIMLQVVGDGTDLAIDDEVDLVLRRYAHERGVPVYGYKARITKGNQS